MTGPTAEQIQHRDTARAREEQFLERLQRYREHIRYYNADPLQFNGYEMERDLDALLMEAANLARIQVLEYSTRIAEAGMALAPRTSIIYPDPKKGASS